MTELDLILMVTYCDTLTEMYLKLIVIVDCSLQCTVFECERIQRHQDRWKRTLSYMLTV